MRFPALNITNKFITYLILLSILPLLIVGGVSYRISSNLLTDEASGYIQQLIINQRDYIDLQLRQVESLISNLSGVEAITDALESASDTSDNFTRLTTQVQIGFILNGYSNLDGLVSIDIFTVSGVHYHVGDTLDTSNIRYDIQERIFEETLDSNMIVKWVGIEENVNANSTYKQVITAGKVLFTFNRDTLQHEPLALLLVNYSVEHLYDYLSQVNLGDNAYMLVVDDKGRIIYHPDTSQLGQQVNPELAETLLSQNKSTRLSIENVDLSVNAVSSDVSNWTVIGLVPIATLAAKSTPIQNAVIIVLIACFASVGVLSWFYHRSVVIPIRIITDQFKALQKNPNLDEQQKIVVQGQDEIAELSRWFNSTQVLYRSNFALINYHDLETLLQRIVDTLVQTTSADRVTLMTVDTTAETITRFVRGGRGLKQIVEITYGELQDGLSGWVMRERKAALSLKGQPDPRESETVRQRRRDTNCGDIIVVPLLYQGNVRGTVTAINRPNDRDFTQQDVDLMVALTNQASIAIENAQLVQSLRDSEEKFVKAFHASPEPMSIVTSDGRFLEVNESFLSITGYTRDEMIGNTTLDIDLWMDDTERTASLDILNKQGFIHDYEANFRSKSGVSLVWLVSAQAIELNGDRCLLIVSKDITHRKQMEEQRIQLSLEQERIQILADFFTEASHEFKTPLSIINTNAYLLKRLLGEPEYDERLDRISQQVIVISQLIDSLTQMTKLDSGGQELVSQPVDIRENIAFYLL